jgi:glycosyltransferase involved in cell wall biosynthesis
VAPPPLTIGLPVYNGERFLADTIASVLAQDYTDFALYISDNASTDATEEICRDAAADDARVTFVRHPRNRGAIWNFNHCFHATGGELFKWAAHDDVLLPEWVGRCVEVLSERPDAVLAFTERVKIDGQGEVVKQNRRRPVRYIDAGAAPGERFADVLRRRRGVIEVFGLARRSVMGQTSLLGDYPGSDRVFLAEMALRGPFAEVPEVLFHHREHDGRSIRVPLDAEHQEALLGTLPAHPARLRTLRTGVEFGRAVRRAPIGGRDRWQSYAAIPSWALHRWRLIARKVLGTGARLARPRRRRAAN